MAIGAERTTDMQPAQAETICPVCGNLVAAVPILFGYPTPEAWEKSQAGEIELGGCVVTGHDPTHRCPVCGAPLERRPDDDDEEAGAFLSYLLDE